MIIVHGLRCGYDGGGMACGPVSGSINVELRIVADELIHFVLVSQYENFERVVVSKRQMFDTFMDMPYNDIDWEKQTEETLREAIESYDYELGDEPENMFHSRFAKAIHLARLAMQGYYPFEMNASAYAEAFIEEYVGEDIDELELPGLEGCDDEDEEDEEE